MAISGSASYVWTTDEFLAHWSSVNAALGPEGPLLVLGGASHTTLSDLYTTLVAQRGEVQAALNARELARSQINMGKTALLARLEQFRGRVQSTFAGQSAGAAFAAALPVLPGFSENEARFLDAFDDAANLWQRIATAGTTLVLAGGYEMETFQDDIAGLRAFYRAYTLAMSDFRLALRQRDATQDAIYPVLKAYRQAVPSYFPAGSPYVESLPRLTPLPGATPQPVNASAVWDAAEEKGRIAWDASTDPDLQNYQVRYTPGPDYDDEADEVVATVAPAEPRVLLTLAGLTQPGAVSSFKVFVITTSGNIAGSPAMQITRPPA